MTGPRENRLIVGSVNLGTERIVGNSVSGIHKLRTRDPVEIGREGLFGDVVSDRRHHGGPDQAVYVYGDDDYKWWREQLGETLVPGTFGDNLTILNLSCRNVFIGDQLHVGNDVVLQVTAPRIPCATLGARMEKKQFPVRFRRAERPGFYCRVLKTGTIVEGDSTKLVEYDSFTKFSVVEVFRLYYEPNANQEVIRQVLQQPLAIRERKRLESTQARRRNLE